MAETWTDPWPIVVPPVENGISQFLPPCVVAVTVKSCMPLPGVEMTTGWLCGLPCVAPDAAVKLSVVGLAVNSVNPPTLALTNTVTAPEGLFCGVRVKVVS